MKSKLFILGFVLILSALILGGCGPTTVEPPHPITHLIHLREGDIYTVALESDGYRWQVEFDESFLELVEHSYDPDSNQEIFTFRALAWAYVEVYFSYHRRHEVIYIFNIGVDPALAEEMTLAEAREIAMNSECAEVGEIKETGLYNDRSGTWWIDLDAKKKGCAPACVINVRTRQAEVNWRCTGAIPIDRVLATLVVIAILYFILRLIWGRFRRKRKAA